MPSEHWTAERVAREAELPQMPEFSWRRHRTVERYREELDAWKHECAKRRLALFDRVVDSLGLGGQD